VRDGIGSVVPFEEMATEDEILRAYEAEFGPQPPAHRNRGFWLVIGVLLAAGAFLVVEILAHRPLANTIGHAQATLRLAQGAAEAVRSETGGFAEADAAGLATAAPSLRFRDPGEPSGGLDEVSVAASGRIWAAAVQARPGACFYLRLEVGADPRYGSGTECTGEAALRAAEPRW
jgi:hypothetical protein